MGTFCISILTVGIGSYFIFEAIGSSLDTFFGGFGQVFVSFWAGNRQSYLATLPRSHMDSEDLEYSAQIK